MASNDWGRGHRVLLARRTRTIRMCSFDTRIEGPHDHNPSHEVSPRSFAAPAGVVRGDSLDARSESHPDLPTQAMNECPFDMPSEGL